MLYAHRPVQGLPLDECAEHDTGRQACGNRCESSTTTRSPTATCAANGITVDDGTVLFGGFGSAEYGATDAQLQSDIAQLLVTTSALYDAESAVSAAIDAFGKDTVLTASRRLTKSAVPKQIRRSIADAGAVISGARAEVKRQTGADQIKTETITRFTRSQVIQLVLLVALVYVAYPFISTVPTFFSQVSRANWWWALLGLVISALTYVGAAAALWASADESVSFWRLSIAQVANTFAATTTPAGVGGLALSTRYLQKGGGLSAVRATTAVALQQAVQVIMHLVLLILFSTVAGASMDLKHFVPDATVLYLIAGVALGIVGTFLLVPRLRHWLATEVRPKLKEVTRDLVEVTREPKRLGLIVLGCAGTTLGAALALWASVEAFGGGATFVTVHRGDDGRRNAGLGRADARRRRSRRSGIDRWSRRLRRTRGRRRAVGSAVSGAHLLAAGIRRLAGDAVADRERDGLGSRALYPTCRVTTPSGLWLCSVSRRQRLRAN